MNFRPLKPVRNLVWLNQHSLETVNLMLTKRRTEMGNWKRNSYCVAAAIEVDVAVMTRFDGTKQTDFKSEGLSLHPFCRKEIVWFKNKVRVKS